jgi:hypothetical protein
MTQATTRHDPDSGSRERADSHSQAARRAGPLRDGAACLAVGDAPEAVPPLDGQGRVRTLSPRDGHPFHLAHREMDVLPLFPRYAICSSPLGTGRATSWRRTIAARRRVRAADEPRSHDGEASQPPAQTIQATRP